jgi:hypothetical protein
MNGDAFPLHGRPVDSNSSRIAGLRKALILSLYASVSRTYCGSAHTRRRDH